MTSSKKRQIVDLAARQMGAGKLDEAEALCRDLLASDPKQAEAWFILGWIARRRNDTGQAIESFRKAVASDRNDPRFHNGLGVALMAAGRTAEAAAAFRKALDLRPADADAQGNLARALWLRGDLDGAESAYRKAVTLAPDLPALRHNFGKLLRFRGRPADAAEQHAHAVRLAPRNAEFHLGLGLDLLAAHAFDQAADALTQAVALRPDDADLRANQAYALYRAGRWAQTIEACENVLSRAPSPMIRLLLSQSLYHAGQRDRAVAECERVLGDLPNWQMARFLHETMTAPDRVTSIPGEAIAGLFDHYADDFDEHLLQELKYQAPRLIHAAVQAVDARREGLSIIDLGCGTGLCGALFKPMASRLAGVDLSPRMLEKAAARGVYDALLLGDLVDALAREPDAFDLVLAADVLLYLGDLDAVFAAATRALRRGGLFAFTVEALTDDEGGHPFLLRPSRRFAHALAYLRELAGKHGLNELHADTATLRREDGADVRGFILVFRK